MSVGTRNPTATDATLQTSAASSARAEENKKHLASAVYPKPFDIIVFAVWFGVLVGLLEVACLAARIFIRGRTVGQPVDVIWMAPVADAGLFLQIGAGGALLAWRFTRLLSLRTTVMAFAAVGVFCVLLHAPSLHIYAALLLAIGIGWQTGQLIASDPRRLIAMVHGSTAWARLRCSGKKACIGSATDEELTCRLNRRQVLIGSSATVAGLMAGVATWRTVTTRRAISALPAAVTGAPNVLLIVLDTVRAESLSLYGYDRPTSRALERLAQTGVRFLRAFSCAPWTLPSHASMFTGRFPHELSADWIKPLDSRYPTLAEALGASGYETAGFVANTKYCGRHTGLHRGFVHYEDFPVSPIQVLRASAFGAKLDDKIRLATGYEELPGRKSAGELNTDFLNWLRNRTDVQRPFFAFLNFFDAHEPCIPTEGFAAAFSSRVPSRVTLNPFHRYSPDETAALRDNYDRCVAGQDERIGQLFDDLALGGHLDNTIVILTSDHGDQFGEHGLTDHSNSLYTQLLHVPLIVSFPSRLPHGATVQQPASLRDLPATILDLIQIKDEWNFPGTSWMRQSTAGSEKSENFLLSEVSAGVPGVPSWWRNHKGPMHSLVCGNLHYIRNTEGNEELFDIENDPSELQNLAGAEQGGHREIRRFRLALNQALGQNLAT